MKEKPCETQIKPVAEGGGSRGPWGNFLYGGKGGPLQKGGILGERTGEFIPPTQPLRPASIRVMTSLIMAGCSGGIDNGTESAVWGGMSGERFLTSLC